MDLLQLSLTNMCLMRICQAKTWRQRRFGLIRGSRRPIEDASPYVHDTGPVEPCRVTTSPQVPGAGCCRRSWERHSGNNPRHVSGASPARVYALIAALVRHPGARAPLGPAGPLARSAPETMLCCFEVLILSECHDSEEHGRSWEVSEQNPHRRRGRS